MKKGDTLSLQKGWEIKKLGEVLKLEYGKPLSDEERVIDGRFPVYGANGLKGRSNVFYRDKKTVIVGRKGSAGEINLTEEKFWPLDVTYFATFDEKKYDLLFLYHLLTLLDLPKLAKGVKPGINRNEVYDLSVSIPPLPEQHHIVSILDQCFSAIDKAKANAEQNLKNAKELFESYLQGVFENGKWEMKDLGDLCLLITKGSSPKWQGINYVDRHGVLFVTSENVGEGKMLLDTKKYVEEKFNLKDKKSILKNGDVLTNIVGASIGRTAIYDMNEVANINQAVCILRCNPKMINNNFLMNLLNSPFLKKILHDNEVNTARANLSLGFFNKLNIPCPPFTEQQTIVRELDALRTETQKMEITYKKKIVGLEELKKSILQRVFAGELTEKSMAL